MFGLLFFNVGNFTTTIPVGVSGILAGATLKISRKFQIFPVIVPVIGTISCCSLVIFLTPVSWIIGIIGW